MERRLAAIVCADVAGYPLETQSAKVVDHLDRQSQRRDRQRSDAFAAFPLRDNERGPGRETGEGMRGAACVRHRRARRYADRFQARDHVGKHGVLIAVQMAGASGIDDEAIRIVGGNDRRIRLLRRMVDDAAPRDLVSVQREPASRDRILGLLMDDVASSADQLIRVASSSDLPIGRFLDVGRAALPFLAKEQREKFVIELLGRALAEADVDDERVPSLLEETIGSFSARHLIHMATPTGAPTQRVAANLVFLSKGSDRIRETAAVAIEELCERLIHRYGESGPDRP